MPYPLNPTSLPAQGPAGHGLAWMGPGGDRSVTACGSWCDGWQSPGLGPVQLLALQQSPGIAQSSGCWGDDLAAAWHVPGGGLATTFIKSSNNETNYLTNPVEHMGMKPYVVIAPSLISFPAPSWATVLLS